MLENLDPEGKYTQEQIEKRIQTIKRDLEQLLKRSGREDKSDELDLSKLFDLGFQISKNGENLSNGEKQVINIIRTLLRDVKIVFLDEATSNMDPHTGILVTPLMLITLFL